MSNLKYIIMKVLVFIFMFFLSVPLFSQTLSYSYDAVGNRVLREIILLRQSDIKSKSRSEKPLEEELSGKTIKIYPNPTKGELKIEVVDWDEKCFGDVYIYSANGVLVRQNNLSDNIQIMNISNEPSGLYILKIDMNNNISTWRVVKE